MNWQKARRSDLPELVEFLREQEWDCVTFSSRLRQSDRVVVPSGDETAYVCRVRRTGTVCAALLASRSGLLFPVFRSATGVPHQTDLPRSYGPRRVYSIMGIDEYVRSMERSIPISPSHRIEYFLMALDGPHALPAIDGTPGVRVRSATSEDLDALFPLQRRYEQEEVLLPHHQLNVALCYRNLKETLRTQTVLLAEADGKVVAKANTNARGFRYEQVGGVFTEKPYRNRGIASLLMRRLAGIIHARNKRVCLFVKKDNPPALSLYGNLGFRSRGNFTITYFA